MYSKDKNIGYPSKSCVLGVVTGASFKLIASVFSYLSAFEVGTKSGLSLRFSVPGGA